LHLIFFDSAPKSREKQKIKIGPMFQIPPFRQRR